MSATHEGIYTQKQIDYVNSVKDSDLRDHLLHQVRLRDNMEEDRDAFEKQLSDKNSVEHAIKILTKALKEDEGYKIGWTSSIAMAFKDDYYWYKNNKEKDYLNNEDIHIVANNAAENFINLLCK